MSNAEKIKAPAKSNAQRQAEHKARIRNLAERGAHALHNVQQFETLVNWLSWKGDPVACAIVQLSETESIAGWITGLAAKRQQIEIEERNQAKGIEPITKEPRKAGKAATRPRKAATKEPKATGKSLATVAPTKGRRKATKGATG